VVSPLVGAPVGRDLGYSLVPTEAFWIDDNRHAVLTNTYLPLGSASEPKERERRRQRPTVTVVDVSTREVQANVELKDALSTKQFYHIDGVAWDGRKSELTIHYEGETVDAAVPAAESYAFRSGEWMRTSGEEHHLGAEFDDDLSLSVRQDLNHPPALWAQVHDSKAESIIWDANPQIEDLKLGKASIYRWRDTKGRAQSAILALPPDYDANQRYPLVIQTHGYEAAKFFADGQYTTGSGGRALVAKNIIVLQMEDTSLRPSTPQEARDNLAGFESAISHLVSDGTVDRSRVGVIGFSRTSYYVLQALTRRPDLFAAAMTTSPDFGYVLYITWSAGGDLSEGQREVEGLYGGTPYGDGLLKWFKSASSFNLHQVAAPLLMTSTEKGELFQEWETYAGLRRLNKPVDMLWWWKENTPHILVQPAQRYVSQQSAVDWFDFWLNGHEDPDPTKAEQYSRWRKLRRLQEENHRPVALHSK
jgi:hypothetical protein